MKFDDGMPKALREKLARLPINEIHWLHRDRLKPNDYNPNYMQRAELDLLAVSIVEDTWTVPVVVLANDDGSFDIVDGFHRWKLSGDARIRAIYGGYVPCIVIKADPIHRKMSTIRHNRARGVHGVVPMAEIVRGMLADGIESEQLQKRLGMDDEEVARLADRAGMPERMRKRGAVEFGKEWVPSRDA